MAYSECLLICNAKKVFLKPLIYLVPTLIKLMAFIPNSSLEFSYELVAVLKLY